MACPVGIVGKWHYCTFGFDQHAVVPLCWPVVVHAEVGFNHYCGRMGYQMPQTATLLAKCRPEG